MTETAEPGTVTATVEEMLRASRGGVMPTPVATPAEKPTATPVAVPVNRAIGGSRHRRRSDQRWEVTEADLNMYGLIVGRAPTEAEKVAALSPVPNEATALRDAGAGRGGFAVFPRWGERVRNGDGSSWSPGVMFSYLRDVYYFGTSLTGPQVSAWVRQMSGEARRRLQETQARLAAPRGR